MKNRLLCCDFSTRWAEGFKHRFSEHQDEHGLQAPIQAAALADWLCRAPAEHMRYLFFAVQQGGPLPADKQSHQLAVELLVFAACRVLNLDCFLAAPVRRVTADRNFPEAQVCDWPTSAASIAGIVRSALSGQFIAVDRHCSLAGAIQVELAKIHSIDGQSEMLTLLYRELLGREFSAKELAADDEATRTRKANAAWAPVRKELSDRRLKKQSVAIVIVPPPQADLDPLERTAMANHLALMINTTLFQLRPEPAETFPLTEQDLVIEVETVLKELAPPPKDLVSQNTNEAFPHDVFISYASEDREFARALAEYLQSHGAKVWIDYSEMQTGDLLLQKINAALKNSQFCAALFSERYFEKVWTLLESSAAIGNEMNGLRPTMLLPIRHKMTQAQLTKLAPLLAARIVTDSESGVQEVARAILARIKH